MTILSETTIKSFLYEYAAFIFPIWDDRYDELYSLIDELKLHHALLLNAKAILEETTSTNQYIFSSFCLTRLAHICAEIKNPLLLQTSKPLIQTITQNVMDYFKNHDDIQLRPSDLLTLKNNLTSLQTNIQTEKRKIEIEISEIEEIRHFFKRPQQTIENDSPTIAPLPGQAEEMHDEPRPITPPFSEEVSKLEAYRTCLRLINEMNFLIHITLHPSPQHMREQQLESSKLNAFKQRIRGFASRSSSQTSTASLQEDEDTFIIPIASSTHTSRSRFRQWLKEKFDALRHSKSYQPGFHGQVPQTEITSAPEEAASRIHEAWSQTASSSDIPGQMRRHPSLKKLVNKLLRRSKSMEESKTLHPQ